VRGLKTQQRWLFIGAVILFLCVALGAFAAHALKTRLDAAALHQFELGIRYALIHGLSIMIAALAYPYAASPAHLARAVALLLSGIALFSGSLLLLSLSGIKAFAFLTPIGGLAFLSGWVYFALSMRNKR